MRPINIYAFTRISGTQRLERIERQMSQRPKALKIRAWEIDDLKMFVTRLTSVMESATGLDFYYSFTLPKLGKEFDLLRISDSMVVNIELKSGNVTDDAIQKQLLQNRYYLSTLGRPAFYYTYIRRDGRLLRLSNAGRLVAAGWEELAAVLERQTDCFEGQIEELFKEDQFMISPLTDPGRFLRQEYFLTAQQNDIEKQILKRIAKSGTGDGHLIAQGFTGLPGTGKTLLLYDLAMKLSRHDRVCVFHPGLYSKELEKLNERLKRIDFLPEDTEAAVLTRSYSSIMVDEAQRLSPEMLSRIMTLSKEWNAPVIFSYDTEEPVALSERRTQGVELIEAIPGFVKYRLTNRIRLNRELSAFISCVMTWSCHCVRSGPIPSICISITGMTSRRASRRRSK